MLFVYFLVSSSGKAASTRPQPVDSRKYAKLSGTHPSSAKLNVNLRSVVGLHALEEGRAIWLAILETSTLGGVEKILIIS